MALPEGGVLAGHVVNGNGLTLCGISVNTRKYTALTGCVVRNLGPADSSALSVINDGGAPEGLTVGQCLFKGPVNCVNLNGDAVYLRFGGNVLIGDTAGATRRGYYIDEITAAFAGLAIENETIIDCNGGAIVFTAASSVTLSNITIRNNTYINCATLLSTTNVAFDTSCIIELPGVGSVASAAALTLPFYEVVTVTGTTTITSVVASWTGRRVTLIFPSGLTFLGTAYSAGQAVTIVYDGSAWRVVV